MLANHGREIGLWTLLGSVLLAFVLLSLALFDVGRDPERWPASAGLVLAFGVCAGLTATGLETARLRRHAVTTFACGIAATLAWLFLLWLPPGLERARWDAPVGLGASFLSVFGALVLYRLLVLTPRVDRAFGRLVLAGATLSAIVAAVCALLLVAAEYADHRELSDPLTSVMILALFGSFVGWISVNIVSLLERYARERESDPTIARRVRTRIVCPRCAETVEVASNRQARCPKCRLRLRLNVEEPRCRCGYVLFRLEGDTCPECGRPVPAEDRWAAARAGVDSSGGGSPPSQPG